MTTTSASSSDLIFVSCFVSGFGENSLSELIENLPFDFISNKVICFDIFKNIRTCLDSMKDTSLFSMLFKHLAERLNNVSTHFIDAKFFISYHFVLFLLPNFTKLEKISIDENILSKAFQL
ncbi:hypothetical protein BpHYR1_023371 [Brachionus plicatilis]|uniref:Uncharacterized protein n=1 Tax=Brachionus plicatilis TaxID=10195 RepID=A0A3M7QDL4_BRAPC|nr:hypothetical protein BpHYR1_023371 [Brachionus plicatilis]